LITAVSPSSTVLSVIVDVGRASSERATDPNIAVARTSTSQSGTDLKNFIMRDSLHRQMASVNGVVAIRVHPLVFQT
jgi:hypothetical protein